jgi:hypothetical protein
MGHKMKRISPTAIAKASRCLHTWYLDNFGDPSLKQPLDEGLKMLMERGLAYEKSVVSSLKNLVQPKWDGEHYEEGI